MELHPACKLFPDMSQEDYERLKVSIAHNGVFEPAKSFNGKLLDGKNRVKICGELGIECPIWPLSEDEMGDVTPEEWVLGANLARRHLTAAQRAALAVELMGTKLSAPVKTRTPKPDSGSKTPVASLLAKVPRKTAGRTAKALGVSRDSVQRAKAIKAKNPAAFKALKEGSVSLRAAEADVVLDGMGKPVARQKLHTAFRTRAKMVEAASYARRAKAILKTCVGQPGAEELVITATITKLGAARKNITDSLPHVICASCEGTRSGSCERCTSRGWVKKSEL